MDDIQWKPNYLFEVSWEVCNKVGGIHTVLCTKAPILQKELGDQLIMIGPDLHTGTGVHPEFIEDTQLFPTWKAHVQQHGLRVRAGRWNIPGQPLVLLVDFTPLFQRKNEIFTALWTRFRLDSLSGQWDYIEPAMFGYAAGIIIECFYHCHLNATDKIICQFHEWLTGAGVLYLEEHTPQVATVFTTHATVIGRTIAGNNQSFYSSFKSINAAQAAKDYNVIAKYSLERTAAATADCFTCVSSFTARECESFLGRRPDFITANGFDASFVPDETSFAGKRATARSRLLAVANALQQQPLSEDTLLIVHSGRYEFRNKGIDVFIDSLALLNQDKAPDRPIAAFIFVPARHSGPRKTLQECLQAGRQGAGDVLTHNLQDADADPILARIRERRLNNATGSAVKVIFAPVYLDGNDGIFDLPYYDLLIGFDMAVFPSYYEPWGYTPLESLAFHIPAITTTVSGFGAAVSSLPEYDGKGLYVLERNDGNAQDISAAIAGIIRNNTLQADQAAREPAAAISQLFLWEKLIRHYYMAYDFAIQKSLEREDLFRGKPQVAPAEITSHQLPAQPVWRNIKIQAALPPALADLQALSVNLWWCWNEDARELFAYAAAAQGQEGNQNPISVLKTLRLDTMRKLGKDAVFLNMLAKVNARFAACMEPAKANKPLVAYCCMEYALHTDLHLYSGGLGVLAGDYLKAASDSGMNLVAVGLLYREGYFRQQLSAAGDQLSMPDRLDVDNLPIYPVYDKQGNPLMMKLAFPGRTVTAAVWKIAVGRVPLYLLDTDVAANNPEDRNITARLYSSDLETRLKQEVLLGIGGVRMLQALDIQPDIYHINEGHAAFTAFERIQQLVRLEHLGFEEALEIIRARTQFTTHTSVPAAMDQFSEALLRAYLAYLAQDFNISWSRLMGLGRTDANNDAEPFSMYYFAARLSQGINAVSRLHRQVSCRLLHALWKDDRPGELPVTSITNGVHYPTWVSAHWPWQQIGDMSASAIWKARTTLKKEMLQAIRARLNKAPAGHTHAVMQLQVLNGWNAQALTIGFARRFAPYKRAELLFTDISRLAAVLTNGERPVQVIIAGKAHPNDNDGIALLKRVVGASRMPALGNKVLFLEDYDMELGAILTQGVDVWLNNPRVEREACGTSGMKAVLNGALHCSVKDGWWAEAYRAGAGWALETPPVYDGAGAQDQQDAASLYQLLEEEIVPLFYTRNADSIPDGWVECIKNAMAAFTPVYNMQRMVAEYQACYEELYHRSSPLLAEHYEGVRSLVAWKKKLHTIWDEIHVMTVEQPEEDDPLQAVGKEFTARLVLYTGSVDVKDIVVEIVFADKADQENYVLVQELLPVKYNGRRVTFEGMISFPYPGAYEYSFRIFPKHPLLYNRQSFPLIKWI